LLASWSLQSALRSGGTDRLDRAAALPRFEHVTLVYLNNGRLQASMAAFKQHPKACPPDSAEGKSRAPEDSQELQKGLTRKRS
jgi:hypothetical protein